MLANDSNIPINQIGRIERAEINTSLITIYKISKALEIDVKELIKVGELCDKYDPEKETCYLIHPEINLT